MGESDQTSTRWRIRSIVHTFIVASVLRGLDFVRVEVEVQEVFQGLRVPKKHTRTSVYRGLGGSVRPRRLDVHLTAEGTEAGQIWFTTRAECVRSLHLITLNGHATHTAQNEMQRRHSRAWHGSNSNVSMGLLDGLILMGRVGSSRLDCVAGLTKQVKDFWQRPSSPPRSIQTYLEFTVSQVPSVASHLVSHSMGGALERRAPP
jgi:hypothetical protein